MSSVEQPKAVDAKSWRAPAARDAIVIFVLITAVILLVWNGSAFFRNVRLGSEQFGGDVRIASTALTLNVALILFG